MSSQAIMKNREKAKLQISEFKEGLSLLISWTLKYKEIL